MDIKIARHKLKYIDNKLKFFFIERLKIIEKIKIIKLKNQINIYDCNREVILKNRLIKSLNALDPLNIFYEDLLENIFKISKIYQIFDKNNNVENISKIFYINNINIKIIKKNFKFDGEYICLKKLNILICNVSKIPNSIGIFEYNYINCMNINNFIKVVRKNNVVVNIYNKNKICIFLIKGKKKNVNK